MPGRPNPDQQMRMYMKLRCHPSSAHRCCRNQPQREHWPPDRMRSAVAVSQKSAERPLRRDCADPLGGLLGESILPLLVTRPGMRPVMVLDEKHRAIPSAIGIGSVPP